MVQSFDASGDPIAVSLPTPQEVLRNLLATPVRRDLANNLADIYRDLKPGLLSWTTGNEALIPNIVFDWKFPLFGLHWGLHAASAMRALQPIAFLRGIDET